MVDEFTNFRVICAGVWSRIENQKTTPENLRHAHERNDEVLERIYIGRRFKNDTELLEKLFELYTKMTGNQGKVKTT